MIPEKLDEILDMFQFRPDFDFKGGALKIIKGPIIPMLLVAIMAYMTGMIILQYLDLEIWRHDSFHYTVDSSWYQGNVKQEGRWINYYLFDLIKAIPGHVAGIANLLLLALFSYLVTSKLIEDRYLRVIFSLGIVMMPFVHSQNMWPSITFLPIAALPCFYFLSKKIHPILVFGISAIFYFGTLSNFYFLIPFIYLGQMQDYLSGNILKDTMAVFKKVLLPYTLCFILGFLSANGVVHLITNGPIELAEWREATTAESLPQLLSNINGIHERIELFGTKVFAEAHVLIWISLLLFVIFSLSKKRIWALLVLLVIFLSAFYTTAYHGIFISDRTLVTSIIPAIGIFLILPGMKFKNNILHLALCVALIWPFFQRSYDQLELFDKITGYYKHHIEEATETLPLVAKNEAFVFVKGSEVLELNNKIIDYVGVGNAFRYCEFLNAPNRTIVTSLRAIGYDNVFLVNDENMINDVKTQIANLNTETDVFTILSMKDRPSAFGIMLNNPALDTTSFEQF